MYTEKEIIIDEKSLETIIKGIDLASNIVKKTLGPHGSNVMYTDQWGITRISNDGVTILKQVFAHNETMQMAIDALKQQAMRTNMMAGDASTTFVTLNQAILHEGKKSKKHPLEKRREIDEHSKIVLNELKGTAKEVETFEDIAQVATISVEDSEIGSLIADAYLTVGKEGKVDVQESEVNGVRVEYNPGLTIDEGYIAEFMMNNERGEAVLHKPYILIVDLKISEINTILPIVQNLADNGVTEMLLVCDGLDGNMLTTISKNTYAKRVEGKNVMEIIAVKFPAVRKQEFIEDIALVTEAKVFGMTTGIFPDKAPICKSRNPQTGQPQDPQYLIDSKKFIEDHIGRCDKVVITGKKTTFIGGKGNIDEKIEVLRNQKESNSESVINSEAIDARIARLKGEVAVIKVGSASGIDLGYIKDKIEDAVYATKGAMEEGAVRGGGVALKLIAQDLPDGILKNALQAPYNQIQENAGGHFKIEDDVFDSAKSTRIVVENACSFAGSLLTTGSTIATVRIKPHN